MVYSHIIYDVASLNHITPLSKTHQALEVILVYV